MSDILIVLKLRRRSGVLASAVAALGRCGLEFRSQRLGDEDGPRLDLKAEGQLDNAQAVLNAYAEVRGVAEVLEVLVDGQSLLHHDPVPEPEDENSPAEPEIDQGAESATDIPEQAMAIEPELEETPAEAWSDLDDRDDMHRGVDDAALVPPQVEAANAPIEGEEVTASSEDDAPQPEAGAEPDEDAEDDPEAERRRKERAMRMIMRRRRRWY